MNKRICLIEGAGFISNDRRQLGKLPGHERGDRRRKCNIPKYIFWGVAEYAANCHIGGALSEYNKELDRKEKNGIFGLMNYTRECTTQMHSRFFYLDL